MTSNRKYLRSNREGNYTGYKKDASKLTENKHIRVKIEYVSKCNISKEETRSDTWPLAQGGRREGEDDHKHAEEESKVAQYDKSEAYSLNPCARSLSPGE